MSNFGKIDVVFADGGLRTHSSDGLFGLQLLAAATGRTV